ncbi:MAG: BlaI/MecI/CopY family transcriptional regulator [Verrucomicrobiae bacterium]|nr:BlaI/MecI/CopY family transcriptional regulator [Verrucomicrobiae bacterium]
MPREVSKYPTELELQILKILWESGPLPVRDVRQALAEREKKRLAHTSVVTTLNNMVAKKYLKRKAQGNAYIFEAKVHRDEVSKGMVGDLVKRVFDGSASALMLNLLADEEFSEAEREELSQLIYTYRQQQQPGEKK